MAEHTENGIHLHRFLLISFLQALIFLEAAPIFLFCRERNSRNRRLKGVVGGTTASNFISINLKN